MTVRRTTASQPRVIERWFPCAEVSTASGSGWGSSGAETRLMTWFAKRPLAQARAAVLCSLLPWPEDPNEQVRVQSVLREALGACQDPSWYECVDGKCSTVDCNRGGHMKQASRPHAYGIIDCARHDPTGGYDSARSDVLQLLKEAYPDRPAELLDPFSGRGLIPLEAARYSQQAYAIDYSPVATLASRLLVDWPFRDWSGEPELTFVSGMGQTRSFDAGDPLRLLRDVEAVQVEVQRRIENELDEFYPKNDDGTRPWGYLWAQVIPCDRCDREFPLYGSNELRRPASDGVDPGCSFEIRTSGDSWSTIISEGLTSQLVTMRAKGNKRGKLAWCPFADCGHAHELSEHKRLVSERFDNLALLVVADANGGKKTYRLPTSDEIWAAHLAKARLAELTVNCLPARPHERVPIGTDAVVAGLYGAQSFGDLSLDRQNLLHAIIAQSISDIGRHLRDALVSDEYVRALTGYAGATLVRKLRNSTRGAALYPKQNAVGDIFVSESSVGFNYDFFETGISSGPGTWSTKIGAPKFIGNQSLVGGRPGIVQRGSALALPFRDGTLDAVVTDPPYGMYIDYSDASDLFYVWLRRALAGIHPDFAITSNPKGVQEKNEEIITKRHYKNLRDHRTPEFYKQNISKAFAECRRAVHPDGVVTIVFGHGDPEAWRNLLEAISDAGLVLTGAWPANTEKGGQAGSANIQTTLTLACRAAPLYRPDGRVAEVDAEMRAIIAERVRDVWTPSGLSYVDQKMAAAGPALEVVGRYGRILDKVGKPVDLTRYLPLARQAVTEAHDLRFDALPLDTFDQKTRFALEWVRSFGRQVQAASEARWNRLAADMEEADVEGVLADVVKGVRLALSTEVRVKPSEGVSVFEAALAAAVAWRDGSLADAAAAIRTCGVEADDAHFWACLNALAKNLPETDADGSVWTAMVRNRDALAAGIMNAESAAAAVVDQERQVARVNAMNPALFETPNSLFDQESDVR